MIYPRGKQRTGPVGGFCTSFCLGWSTISKGPFPTKLGEVPSASPGSFYPWVV